MNTDPKLARDVAVPHVALTIHKQNILWRSAAEVLGLMCLGLLAYAIWLQVNQ